MGIIPSKIGVSKFQNHMHIFITQEESRQNFQVNPMKDVGIAKTRSLGQTAGKTDIRMDRITHTLTDKGHFYSAPPPTSGDNEENEWE